MFLAAMTGHVGQAGLDADGLAVSVFGCVGKDVIVILPSLIWSTAMTMIKKGAKGYSVRQN